MARNRGDTVIGLLFLTNTSNTWLSDWCHFFTPLLFTQAYDFIIVTA